MLELMVWPSDDSTRRRYAGLAHRVAWLRRHPGLVLLLAAVGVVVALILDLVIPGYAIAGFYLLPIVLVAIALRVRLAIAVSVLCLALTVWVMVRQDRVDGQNILLIVFGVLGGIALIALADLFNRVEDLYESERSSIARLQSASARLETLQKVSVVVNKLLTTDDILARIASSGAELLDADCLVASRRGSTSLTHAACSPCAEDVETLEEQGRPAAAADGLWSSPAPDERSRGAASQPAAATSGAAMVAEGGRLLRVPLDPRLLGIEDADAEAALIFVRRPGEPSFDREDEMLAATLAALLSGALGRVRARA